MASRRAAKRSVPPSIPFSPVRFPSAAIPFFLYFFRPVCYNTPGYARAGGMPAERQGRSASHMNVIRKEGVFRLFDRHATLILTDEKQLERIANEPEKPLFDDAELGFSNEKQSRYPVGTTLESFVKQAKEKGCERIEVSYDFFFGGTTRLNYPDSPTTLKAFKQIHDCAAKYGMSFGASLISPLDLGGGYVQKHDNTGFQWHFQEGRIADGGFTVQMRRQIQWYNNKGPVALTIHRVMAVAFDAEKLTDQGLYYVDENDIEDISDTVRWSLVPHTTVMTDQGYSYDDIVIRGKTSTRHKRVLAVIEYRTPELDYFDQIALPYIKGVIDQHNELGISYAGFYSDEMHIQFDWDLFNHFGPDTEITTRYVTPALIQTYADLYGDKYRDFLKYMVYFAYQQHVFLPGETPHEGSQYVMGRDAQGAYDTWLFRKRYFELLSGRVVSLAIDSRSYAESLFGGPIMCRAHATWQESPTCDHFAPDVGFQIYGGDPTITRYDYDKPYVWGVSIRENISACCDYFRWNEFLSGGGTDHAEGGFSDRNYYAQALAASFGSLNRFEKAYCAGWGSPREVMRRFTDVGVTYGASDLGDAFVQNMQHRSSDVLMLHPTELNFDQERFGTWMVQYGYCNYITEEKLLKYGHAENGRLVVNGRSYRCLVALFEMFLSPDTFDMIEAFVEGGGRLVWTGVPALRYEDGTDCAERFCRLFGLASIATADRPITLRDKDVTFEGKLKGLFPMRVLTDFLPDYAYPLTADDAQVVARCGEAILGAYVRRGKGQCLCLSFRPRDDQSQSTGTDVSTLFNVLYALEAYAPDSLEVLSRPSDARYIANRFPNGAVSIANHYRTFREDWPGLFYRDPEEDKKFLAGRELPPVEIDLDNMALNGHKVTYHGADSLTYLYKDGQLFGFSGHGSQGIAIDNTVWQFTHVPMDLSFAHIEKDRLAGGLTCALLIRASAPGTVTVPCAFQPTDGGACSLDYFRTDLPVSWKSFPDGTAQVEVTENLVGKWIALTR